MVDPHNLPIFLTVTAQILRLKLSTTYRYIRQGLIPAVRLGRLIRIPGSKILEMAGLGVTDVLPGTRSTNLKMPGLSVRDFFRQYVATAAQRTRKSTVQTYRLAFAAFARCIGYALRRIVKRAGIDKKITFHGLRHTHATYLLQRGIPVRDVAARLGHADPAMTLRTYAQATTEGQHRAAKAIEDLLRDGDLFAASEI